MPIYKKVLAALLPLSLASQLEYSDLCIQFGCEPLLEAILSFDTQSREAFFSKLNAEKQSIYATKEDLVKCVVFYKVVSAQKEFVSYTRSKWTRKS
jgi:hypothetical protein